ncbi:hypothetical protein [Okeania sp. KiyG1]|uniref:hypothetical protein n=1 Tax=Okeania sp. KiyG1 TaxID=2720165 RepID=UPI001922E45A|nr:hypothetical protein [Okeania sp. KiyG1]GGA14804.1 hypothetical protein CYANOKiyG1_28560 [Okeania sp. KiyG1]
MYNNDISRLVIIWRALRFACQEVNEDYKEIAISCLVKATELFQNMSDDEIQAIYNDINESIILKEEEKCL